MKLEDLIAVPKDIAQKGDLEIKGLTADSREIEPGYLFAALPGTQVDGARFISQAVGRGAAAVLTHDDWQRSVSDELDPQVPILARENPRRDLALAAAAFYGAQPKTVCAVTGTNGKTSIVNFLAAIWNLGGVKAASMGSLGVKGPGYTSPLAHTTPDPVRIHKELKELSGAGFTHLAMEASSHGLEQYRLDGVKVSAAAFVNLTRDHLDYHDSFEAYLYAKLRLFGELLRPDGTAVLNADMDVFKTVEDVCWARGLDIMTVGRGGSTIKVTSHTPHGKGQRIGFEWQGKSYDVDLGLFGEFQSCNVLMASALAAATGLEADAIVDRLGSVSGVPGRMEWVGTSGNGAEVFVDFAHTPDALETVLKSARPHSQGKLKVIVGCGGDRDKGKRPQMGRLAALLADEVIVTDDNPRSEDPATIRSQVLGGIEDNKASVTEYDDRRKAIEAGIVSLDKGDILVIAGKGHEQGQIIGSEVVPFDDRSVAKEFLPGGGGVDG